MTFKQLCCTCVEMQLSKRGVLQSHIFQGVTSKRADKKWYTDKKKSKNVFGMDSMRRSLCLL